MTPGWNDPLLSSRIFLSLLPPSAICLKHLRTVSADDATILWWVNSTSAISLIFTSVVTRQNAPLVELRRLSASAQTDREPLSPALSRASNAGCSLCRWHTSGDKHEGVFSREALPIVLDFSEGNPFSETVAAIRSINPLVSPQLPVGVALSAR